jgi:carboxylesterase type B
MTKAAAVAYGILIDKAQLLSGAATQRFGSEDPRERAERILDELGARRAEREQRAS